MEEEGALSQQKDQVIEEEVDALFQKTQLNGSLQNDRYDLYVPLAVRIENSRWNCLSPIIDSNTNEDFAQHLDEVVMPAGIMSG